MKCRFSESDPSEAFEKCAPVLWALIMQQQTHAHLAPGGTAVAPPLATRAPAWAHVSDADWNDWQWQQAHRIRTVDELAQVVTLTDDERHAVTEAGNLFAMAITPYYASLMDPVDPNCPIRQQAIPRLAELVQDPSERDDPLAEDTYMPVPGLTHRYPDRVMLYTTHNCPVYCRHCNRKRKVGDPETAAPKAQLAACVAYIAQHPEIRDVLISGGDPLTYSDDRLEALIADLRAIPHLELIRLATRNPVTLPQRITPELAQRLAKYHPIFVNTHFNHLKECTPEAERALRLLADAGCVLGNQTVLLKGINDNAEMLKKMYQWLLARRTRPYYLFQCDAAQGISHFRTPVAVGLEIIEKLRGWTSGLAVPHYVVDLTGGGGKVPLVPNYLVQKDGRQLTFRNYAGDLYVYEEGEPAV